MKTFFGLIWITRPLNLIIIFFAILLGYISSEKTINFPDILYFIPLLFIAAGGYVLNDIIDIKEDKINRPERVLVKKIISKIYAKIFLLILFFFSIIFVINKPILLFFAFILIILVIIYDLFLKSTPLVGNITTALVSSSPILWGAAVTGYIPNISIFISLLAFSIHLPREIIKDMTDYSGDKCSGRKTTPVLFGNKRTKLIAIFTFVPALLMITAIPLIFNFSVIFLLLTAIFVLLPFLLSFLYLLYNKYSRSSTVLRITMIFQVILLILVIFTK